MSKLKTHILATTCLALAGAAGFAGDALAASKNVYGGGSSLIAPYLRQAEDCYGLQTALIFSGSPPTAVTEPAFNYTGTPPMNCSTDHVKTDRTLYYISTGSGTGIAALYSHNATLYGNVNPTGPVQNYPEVHYGASDAGLSSTDVGEYNNGNVGVSGGEHGVTVVAPGVTPGAGQYPNPNQLYGPLVQFPLSIDPVAISYDPVYKKVFSGGNVTSYKFNIHALRTDGSGGLHLDSATYCKIFTGQITNWNDSALKKLNGNVSLEDPTDPTPASSWSIPLQIVGRSDSSGTTSIFTRHLAAVCGSSDYVDGNTTLPTSLFGANYTKTNPNYPAAPGEKLGFYTEASGSDGVAQYIAFTATPDSGTPTIVQGRIGYLGPDYALPAVLSTGANAYGLNTASLKNAFGQFEAPTGTTAVTAYTSLTPPQSDSTGAYDPSNTASGNRNDPSAWVQSLSHLSVLANPTNKGAYPIVGTTNFLGYTCYANSAQKSTLTGFLTWFETSKVAATDKTDSILVKAGLAPLPSAWRKAINQTFVTDPYSLQLNINTKGAPGACSATGIVGG